MPSLSLILAAALASGSAQAAAAQGAHVTDLVSVTPAPGAPWACDRAAAGQRAADAALEAAALADPASLPSKLPALEAVLARAPSPPLPRAVICGDRVVVFGDRPIEDAVMGPALIDALRRRGVKVGAVETNGPPPYGMAAFLVGSVLDSGRRYDEAVAVLRKGLALEPADADISAELAFALNQTGRQAEAIAVVDSTLAAAPEMAAILAARLHRARGYALGDLGRFDEAIAEYRNSQALDPAERVSAHEIQYLEHRKAGQGPTPTRVFTSDKKDAPPGVTPQP